MNERDSLVKQKLREFSSESPEVQLALLSILAFERRTAATGSSKYTAEYEEIIGASRREKQAADSTSIPEATSIAGHLRP